MPVYATHEEMNNGFTPAGNVLAAPSGFDVPLPEGTNPAPSRMSRLYGALHFVRITCWARCSARRSSLSL